MVQIEKKKGFLSKISQGSLGIRQWAINSCTSLMINHKNKLKLFQVCDQSQKIQEVKVFGPTNKILSTLGTLLIDSPMSPPSLKKSAPVR